MKIAFHIMVSLFLTYAGLSYAALYKWVDDKGYTHYTTAPPPESAVHDREILGKQGRVLKTIQGRMTPEEKAAYEKKLYEEEQLAKERERQMKRDRNLLISYKSVEEIVDARDAKLSHLGEYIKSLEEALVSANVEYESLLNQAILQEREGKTPSEKLKADLRSAKREYDSHEADLQKAQNERIHTLKLFEENVKRFRELKGL